MTLSLPIARGRRCWLRPPAVPRWDVVLPRIDRVWTSFVRRSASPFAPQRLDSTLRRPTPSSRATLLQEASCFRGPGNSRMATGRFPSGSPSTRCLRSSPAAWTTATLVVGTNSRLNGGESGRPVRRSVVQRARARLDRTSRRVGRLVALHLCAPRLPARARSAGASVVARTSTLFLPVC